MIGSDSSASVRVKDGRDRFRWGNWEDLPELGESYLEKGMVCAVLHTINFYPTPTSKECIRRNVVRKTAGLNIQAVIVLDDKNPYATATTITDRVVPLPPDVANDPAVDLELAVNRNAVIQPPVAQHDPNEALV